MSRKDEDDADRVARNVKRGLWSASILGTIAAVLFIVAIVLEVGKAAGVGGVLLAVAIVVAALTASYADDNGY